MISEGVCDGDEVGFEGAMYFSDDGVLGVDFFTIENTGESLLILIKIHS